MPTIELDWECWALPLSVAFSRDWGQAVIRVGPICISWGWRTTLAELSRIETQLDKLVS